MGVELSAGSKSESRSLSINSSLSEFKELLLTNWVLSKKKRRDRHLVYHNWYTTKTNLNAEHTTEKYGQKQRHSYCGTICCTYRTVSPDVHFNLMITDTTRILRIIVFCHCFLLWYAGLFTRNDFDKNSCVYNTFKFQHFGYLKNDQVKIQFTINKCPH